MDLSNFGKKLKFEQRNQSQTVSEKELFIETID